MENSTPPEARLSETRLSQAGYQAGYQAGSRVGFQPPALMRTRSDSVYSTGISAKTAGSKDRYRSISGRQPYVVT